MLKISIRHLFCCVVLLICMLNSRSQDLSSAGGYISYFNQQLQTVNQTYMNYLSAVSHGKSARKVEKLRNKTVEIILDAKSNVAGSPGFKTDKTYRDATSEYLKTCFLVFNEDYGKIVNMEEIAEQSYDAMEAYLLAQEKATEKLKEAGNKQSDALKQFAAKNNVTLTEEKNDLDIKLEKADKVHSYYKKIYLLFFKSYKQDMYLTDAINKSDLNAIEQNRNALQTDATEGLATLEQVGSFEADASLVVACKKALQFYKQLAEKKMEPITAFLLANDNFKKLKKDFDKKAQKTQADVDAFNKAVNDLNKGGNAYNKVNADINKERTDILNAWNESVKDFLDSHTPYAK